LYTNNLNEDYLFDVTLNKFHKKIIMAIFQNYKRFYLYVMQFVCVQHTIRMYNMQIQTNVKQQRVNIMMINYAH
jgi:hypothetical protein